VTETEQRLRETFETLADEAPHDADLLGTVRSQAGRRWPSPFVLAAAAAVVVVALAAGVLSVLHDQSDTDAVSGVDDAASYECPAALTPTLLPAWARTGFSDPKPRMPSVLADDGQIIAIVFGDPLSSPPAEDHANKILWVVREDAGPLTIRATRAPGEEPTVVEVETGPSYVDLPGTGCWHLDLSWPGHQDSLNLRYH
jgi:hypothetical protein